MDEMDYQATIAAIKSGGEELFRDFMENGVNKAKSVIIKALTENPAGLSYFQLNNLVAKTFLSEERRIAAWKVDSFIVAMGGLELEDKKIKHEINQERGIYTLL